MTEAVTYLDNPDVERLNDVLDQLSSKLYLNQKMFIAGVRAALHFYGINLPTIDAEQHVHGPNAARAMGDLHFGPGHEDNRDTPGVPNEFEYAFEIVHDHDNKLEHPGLYLYMNCDRVSVEDKGEFWDTYAQVVDEDELDDLLADGPPEEESFSDWPGDASGETKYEKLARHSVGSGPKDA